MKFHSLKDLADRFATIAICDWSPTDLSLHNRHPHNSIPNRAMEWSNYIARGVPPNGRGRKLIGGNWKCNGKLQSWWIVSSYRTFRNPLLPTPKILIRLSTYATGTIAQVKTMVNLLNTCGQIPLDSEVVIAVPSLHLLSTKDMIRADIAIAAEV